jgi:hypothetical protein
MDNDPQYQRDESQPKATCCPNCSLFISEDGQYSEHFVPESIKRQYEITEKLCDDCDNEQFRYTVKKVGNKFKLINNEHFKN